MYYERNLQMAMMKKQPSPDKIWAGLDTQTQQWIQEVYHKIQEDKIYVREHNLSALESILVGKEIMLEQLFGINNITQ